MMIALKLAKFRSIELGKMTCNFRIITKPLMRTTFLLQKSEKVIACKFGVWFKRMLNSPLNPKQEILSHEFLLRTIHSGI
jgi:hypothetical protein